MQVQGALLNDMLKGISDPKLRQTYGNIISGKMPFAVYCLDPQKNPETGKPFHAKKCKIGYLDVNGNALDAQTVDKNKEPIAGIVSSRDRFDGRKGFKCYCGNESIRSPEEAAVIGTVKKVPRFNRPPTRDELGKIFQEMQKSGKTGLEFINGWAEYDGFGLEELKK